MALNDAYPLEDELQLTLGADFVLDIELPPPDTFPAGTEVVLKIYPKGQKNTLVTIAEWAATVTTSKAPWRVESTEADTIPDKAHFRIYVKYPDSPTTLDLPWYVGDFYRVQ